VVLRTTWASAAGAQTFRAQADKVVQGLSKSNPTRICGGSTTVSIVVASDETVIPELEACN
jgi:hypothetical protein